MSIIRKAVPADLNRIAEIEVFNYRLIFYPIFRDDQFYFEEFQVTNRSDFYRGNLDHLWVYDDGVIKGFVQTDGAKIQKLFVEPVLQGHGIGAYSVPVFPLCFVGNIRNQLTVVCKTRRTSYGISLDTTSDSR